VKLDAVGNRSSPPTVGLVVIVNDCCVCSRSESWRKGAGDPPLERISREIPHLVLDRLETLSLTLSDLDREELKQVTVIIGRGGAGSLGAVE